MRGMQKCSLRWIVIAGIVLGLGACGDDVIVATPDAMPTCDVADDAHRATCKAMYPGADAFTCMPALNGVTCVDIGDGAFCCKAGPL